MNRRERSSAEVGATGRAPPSNAERSTPPQGPALQPCYDGEMVARALPRSRPRNAFNGVKVFSATKFQDRDLLGDRVTHWLREHPEFEIVDMIVTQSSDAEFHCVTISVFYLERDRAAR
jgi:hypothetical protein